jgi:hypothetical protein
MVFTRKERNRLRPSQMAPMLHQPQIPASFNKCNSKMKALKVNILTRAAHKRPEYMLKGRNTGK